MRARETPVNIPNTTVKPRAADDTVLETAWESRWLPAFKKEKKARVARRKSQAKAAGGGRRVREKESGNSGGRQNGPADGKSVRDAP